ncbi:hypothetical protein [Bordetella genomosp. 13]|uniref:hypothetical protein n=1 Tax=Bordetella genomosp. 13 TaxID=463040 RepID=UPI00119CA352|nr:hypothetical protein [Bordetella genomosp. 13]
MNATTITPTILGANFGADPVAASAPDTQSGLQFPQNFPLALPADQLTAIQRRVDEFDFAAARLQDLALLGQEPTHALNRTLDGFLDRVNKAENPQLFQLVDTLSEEIAKERIGELAEQILAAKPSLWHRFLGLFSKKALQRGLDVAYEELGRIARNKSKSLSDLVQDRERTLKAEMQRLSAEVQAMEAIKNQYREAFNTFAVEVLFLHNALLKAQAQAPALLAAAQDDTMAQQDIQDKLQALESNALSREAMMTRLPAEQLVIRQIQNAGISTMQELAVTMGDRFASIRMTLLAIHGANLVRNVQRLGQANANLDNQLQEARAKLMNAVVSSAATAPGDNRLEQANNLKRVVADTQALHTLVQQARQANRAKFDEARQAMSQVRQDLLSLGQQIQPGAPLAR